MQCAVEAGICELHTRHTADGEQEDESNRPQHRRAESDRTTPHRRDPREDLDTRRNRNHHCGEDEITLRIERQANRVHVVSPDDEADDTDCNHSVSHAEITEDRLTREGRYDVADNAEAWQNQNVHFRMPEEPEQVLVQDRITAAVRRKEGRAEVAVGKQHGDTTCENRQRKQKQERRHQNSPGKERHLVQRHTRRTHVQDRGDEIDRAKNRRSTRDMDCQNGEIHGRSGLAGGREWRI